MNRSFDDTKTAFAYKSDKELRNARFLFKSMSKKWLVKLGMWATPRMLRMQLPVKGLIRNTIFKQFVGGETLEETLKAGVNLARFNVQIILDYGVERKEGEDSFDHAAEEFIRVINFASQQDNIPFMSIKLTGMCRIPLLEKLNMATSYEEVIKGIVHTDGLTGDEKQEWQRVCDRVLRICTIASEKNIGVMVDAEETWIQGPVDALTTKMMQKFNTGKPVVFNTAQLYRHDRLQYIKDSNQYAQKTGYKCAFKLVRGAYMEKERERAAEKGYPSPINADKISTDKMYNEALRYCIDPSSNMFTLVGSHNEASNTLAADLIEMNNMPYDTERVYFSQLYGMSDNITFNLARDGYNATKYLPFGPIHDVIPYLMRRAEENSSLSGQTGRELNLINEEIRRRNREATKS